MRVWGLKILGFDSLNVIGWLMFHGLDIAAVLVIPGAGYFLWRRMKGRGAIPGCATPVRAPGPARSRNPSVPRS